MGAGSSPKGTEQPHRSCKPLNKQVTTGMPKKQNPEDPIEKPVARVKVHRPRRQKAKKQITVRIDQNVLDIALAVAADENLRLTDLVEEGLVLRLKSRRKSANAMRLRFLCNNLPQYLELQTMTFLAWIAFVRPDPFHEASRQGLDKFLNAYRENMPSDYQACLDRLGKLSEEGHDNNNNDGLEVAAS
jgi:uncharacterized protein (DUF4415 family)